MRLAAGRNQAGLTDKQIEYCVEVTARGTLPRHAHKNALCFSYPWTGCAGWGRAVGGLTGGKLSVGVFNAGSSSHGHGTETHVSAVQP